MYNKKSLSVRHAASDDSTRPTLTGIHVKDDIIEATNGRMLARITRKSEEPVPETILPPDTVASLRRQLNSKSEFVIDGEFATANSGNKHYLGKIDEQYPDTDKIIADERRFWQKLSLDVLLLEKVVKIAKDCALTDITIQMQGADAHGYVTKQLRIAAPIDYGQADLLIVLMPMR